ncbi:MAG: hypothetical protein ACREMB_03630 [Candidatus Rokuibacteriota bacterium]
MSRSTETTAGYDIQYWSMVVPLGMYTVATIRFMQAAGWSFLGPLPYVVGGAALVAWVATFVGFLRSLGRRRGTRGRERPLEWPA